MTDIDRVFREIELHVSFARTNPDESFFRPAINGYMFFLARASPLNPDELVLEDIPLAEYTVDELNEQGLGLRSYSVTLPPVVYGSLNYQALVVRAYNDGFNSDGRAVALIGPSVTITDICKFHYSEFVVCLTSFTI